MALSSFLKQLASFLGFHVVRNYQYPPNTFLGLLNHRFATVVDVGANTGQFVRRTVQKIPTAKYYCFEPVPAAFDALSSWAQNFPNVTAANLALSDKPGALRMNIHTDHSTSSSLLNTTEHSHETYPFTQKQEKATVRVSTLDDYFNENSYKLLPEVLLKLDVQGFELPILLGGARTLAQTRALIIEVCVAPLYDGQSDFADVFELLRGHRFKFVGNFDQLYGSDGRVTCMDCVFLREE